MTDAIPSLLSDTETAVTAYLETLLWTDTYYAPEDPEADGEALEVNDDRVSFSGEIEDGTPLDQIVDVSDLDTLNPKISAAAREDLDGFSSYCEETLGFDPFTEFDETQVAYDFALSRNGHGAGFFDREGYEIEPTDEIKALMARSWYEGVGTSKRDPSKVDVRDALQEAAKTFGSHGLMLWVREDGTIGIEDHS
jgi:hypothetical protein